MLRVERIETVVVQLPPRKDFRWLSLTRPLGEFVLVRLQMDGVSGWGEVVALRDWGDVDGRRHGETPSTVLSIVHELFAPVVLGRELALGQLRGILDGAVVGHPYAKALLDIAFHDLAGRLHGVPVHDLLGGRTRDSVPVAHMIGIMPLEQAVAEATGAIEDGVMALQVKGGNSLERDVALIAAIRSAVGDEPLVRLDANGGYRGRAQVRLALRELAAAGVDLVEQPTLGREAMAAAVSDSPVPIMSDESCWSPADAFEVLASRATDYVSVYVGKAGGLSGARDVCSVAAAAGAPHDLNGGLELGVGNAANLQVAFASPGELLPCVVPINAPDGAAPTVTAGRYFLDDIVSSAFLYEDGALKPPLVPGLGVEVDVEKVERYQVAERASS